jgi:cardiolipin synthase
VGGINIWEGQLRRFGAESVQDYAIRVQGPVVRDIREAIRHRVDRRQRSRWRGWRNRIRRVPRDLRHPQQGSQAIFVTRDNGSHPSDIEAMYRIGIRKAKQQITVASAYFFPGYGFLHDLTRAARRGVDVRLILQGKPDVPFSALVGSVLYDYLFAAGVRIYHYRERALHAKVAVIDRAWATIGSSNLDPVSLGFNLEGNLFVLDEPFAASLRGSLDRLIDDSCDDVTTQVPKRSYSRRLLSMALYYLTRHMPRWGHFVLRRTQTTDTLPLPTDR